MIFVAFVLATGGMLALCLAMPRHHRDLLKGQPSRRRRVLCRLLGSVLLAGCVADNLRIAPLDIGLVTALAQIMVAGVLTGLLLGWLSTASSPPMDR